MNIRPMIVLLLENSDDIDDDCRVRIVRRNANLAVTHHAVIPISYIDSYGNICIEETEIKWTPYQNPPEVPNA